MVRDIALDAGPQGDTLLQGLRHRQHSSRLHRRQKPQAEVKALCTHLQAKTLGGGKLVRQEALKHLAPGQPVQDVDLLLWAVLELPGARKVISILQGVAEARTS